MDVDLLLVPYDTGRRGWRMGAGPEHLVNGGLTQQLQEWGHASRIITIEAQHPDAPAEIATTFELIAALSAAVRAAVAGGRFPLVLSGNCSMAVGVLSGLTPAARGVIWFDAHADCHTADTTTSGFLDGTALATALGWTWKGMATAVPGFQPVDDARAVLVGARDIDPAEHALLATSAVMHVPPAPATGAEAVRAAIEVMRGIEAAYLHVDLDVLDPSEGRANGFPTSDGLRLQSIEQIVDTIGAALPVSAAALTAYSPEYDGDGRVAQAAARIAQAIIEAAARRAR